jgi:hypothetical protein
MTPATKADALANDVGASEDDDTRHPALSSGGDDPKPPNLWRRLTTGDLAGQLARQSLL